MVAAVYLLCDVEDGIEGVLEAGVDGEKGKLFGRGSFRLEEKAA